PEAETDEGGQRRIRSLGVEEFDLGGQAQRSDERLRSRAQGEHGEPGRRIRGFDDGRFDLLGGDQGPRLAHIVDVDGFDVIDAGDRKSTRLNSSHVSSSYAVFCLKNKSVS